MHIGGRPAALVEWKPARPGPPDERFPSIFRPTSWGVPKSHGELPVTMVVSMDDLLVIHGLDDLGGDPHDFGNLMKPLHLLVFEKSFPVRFGHIFTTICDLARAPGAPVRMLQRRCFCFPAKYGLVSYFCYTFFYIVLETAWS